MRARSTTIGLALLLMAGRVIEGQTDIVDRIAAVINGKVIITLSDVRKERLIQTALGKEPGTDEQVLQNLVDRYLVEEQIASFPGIEVSEEAVKERLSQIRAASNVDAVDLRSAVVAEIRLSEFIIQRFRQFIRVSDDEVSNYYQGVFVPAAKQKNTSIPPIEAVAGDIRREIVGQKLDNEVRTWLEGLRNRNDIETFQ